MLMFFEPVARYPEAFARRGVQWVSFDSTPTAHDWKVARTVWTGNETYDFTELDARMELLSAENPEALLLPMIFFGTPPWWADEHPDHVMLYETPAGTRLPVRILGRKVASWASPLWREGSLRALDRYLDHVESRPYGRRVAGYYLTAGSGGEEWFQYWGPEGEFTDYSRINEEAFRGFLRTRYEDDRTLRSAWGRDDVDLATVGIPLPHRRREERGSSFHHPVEDRDILDLMDHTARITAETLDLFARRIKERTSGTKLCGAFFGYISSIASEPREHDSGHLGLPLILESPYLDFLSSPSAYTHRRPGVGFRKTMSATESVKLHGKLWWNQMDDRSHIAASRVATGPEKDLPFRERTIARRKARLATVNGYHGVTDTLEETLQGQWAVFAQSLVQGIGHYWFDMQGGWYDDLTLMNAVGHMKSIADRAVRFDRSPVHEVALVVSNESRRFTRQCSHLGVYLLEIQEYYLGKCGLPFGVYLLEDMERIPPHKLWVFANAFHVSDELLAVVHEKTRGSDVVFLHGAGYVGTDGFSIERARRLTGIQVEVESKGYPCLEILPSAHPSVQGLEGETHGQAEATVSPAFHFQDPECIVLGRLTHGGRAGLVVKETGEGRRYSSSTLLVPPGLLRNIARLAGAHVWVNGNDTVRANGSFVAVSATAPGKKVLHLPRETDVVDVKTDRLVARKTRTLELDLPPKATRIFFLGGLPEWEATAACPRHPGQVT
jgi:hypothetical protein